MYESVIEAVLDVALSPALWLSAGLALFTSTLFSIWRWAGIKQLGRDWLFGILGFVVGHIVGGLIGIASLQIGETQVFWGVLGTLATLAFVRRIGWRSPQVR